MSETPITPALSQEKTPTYQYKQPELISAQRSLDTSEARISSGGVINIHSDDHVLDFAMWEQELPREREQSRAQKLEAGLESLSEQEVRKRIKSTSDVIAYIRNRTLAQGLLHDARQLTSRQASLPRRMLSLLTGSPAPVGMSRSKHVASERELVEQEALIGGRLFGEIPADHRREFFMLDADTWVWHEETVDLNSQRHMSSTRYELHQNGILMAQGGSTYRFIEGKELRGFAATVQLYYEAVAQELYQLNPETGRPL